MSDGSRQKSRRDRRLRRIAVLPSLVTLMNAVCGFASIHFAARGMSEPDGLWLHKPELTFFAASAYMIFLAMIADALDGRLARMSRSTSSFGGQLDSLSDMVSFGVAPAFLMLRVVESSREVGPAAPMFVNTLGKLLWFVAVAYICCTALRLARFNVENQPEESAHMGFRGLPSPAAGGVVMSLVLLYSDLLPELSGGPANQIAQISEKVILVSLPLLTATAALLMVSQVPYPHVVNRYIRGRRPFWNVVKLVILVICLCVKPQLTMAVCFVGFAFSSPVKWLWQNRLHNIRDVLGRTHAADNSG